MFGIKIGGKAKLQDIVAAELAEAQLNLLAAEAQLESAQCHVDTYKMRVSRLAERLAPHLRDTQMREMQRQQ